MAERGGEGSGMISFRSYDVMPDASERIGTLLLFQHCFYHLWRGGLLAFSFSFFLLQFSGLLGRDTPSDELLLFPST